MSWSKRDRGKGRRGYHHGNLPEALMKAALELIAEKGPAGFTFAEAARAAGVSPAAPYRHYRDREALMADVAARGLARFETALLAAWNDGLQDAITACQYVRRAYSKVVRDPPHCYAAMFEAGLPPDFSPELAHAADRAFTVLRRASEVVCSKLPEAERPPAVMMALHVWSMSHGIASLFARGDAARRKLPMSPEDLLEAAVLVYLRGLGAGSDAGRVH